MLRCPYCWLRFLRFSEHWAWSGLLVTEHLSPCGSSCSDKHHCGFSHLHYLTICLSCSISILWLLIEYVLCDRGAEWQQSWWRHLILLALQLSSGDYRMKLIWVIIILSFHAFIYHASVCTQSQYIRFGVLPSVVHFLFYIDSVFYVLLFWCIYSLITFPCPNVSPMDHVFCLSVLDTFGLLCYWKKSNLTFNLHSISAVGYCV